MNRCRKLIWSLGSFLATLGVLLVFFFPVIHTGERWMGHLHLEWSFPKVVRVWDIDGRQPEVYVLGVEVAVALLIGGLVWLGVTDRERRDPGSHRGTL